MHELTIIKRNGGNYIDSREVADVIGKQHGHLMRDIAGYVKTMQRINQSNFGVVDFFVESSYLDAKGETRPCYLISKMGCELVANKLIGEKGILFTVAYVTRFNELEAAERAELEAAAAAPAPRLGEFNACARLIVRCLRDMGASPEQILRFLTGVYEPLGISVLADDEIMDAPRMYTAKQIAQMLGIYSQSGNPHYQAVACILNENIFISDDHKIVETEDYGSHVGICVRYDDYALHSVKNWLSDYDYPNEIYGFGRTYRVLYKE